MTKAKAFFIHLGISLAIFAVLLALIVFVWYPSPYFAADGGWQGVRIVAGVDLVLGPLLTLIVFRPGKLGLKLDLTLIGIVQALALGAGVYLVHEQRTALVVYADGGFYSLNTDQIHEAGEKAVAIERAAARAPGYAFVRTPEDKQALLREKLKILSGAPPLYLRGDLYEPLGRDNIQKVLARALDAQALVKDRPDDERKLTGFLQRQGASLQHFAFLPLLCRYERLLLVLDKKDGRIVDALRIDPVPLFDF